MAAKTDSQNFRDLKSDLEQFNVQIWKSTRMNIYLILATKLDKDWPCGELAPRCASDNGLWLGDVAAKRTEFYRQDRTFA